MEQLDEMRVETDTTPEQILKSLISGKTENIDLITEINSPITMSQFEVLIERLNHAGCNESAKMITAFISAYKRYMVSYNRQSRREIISALGQGMGDFGGQVLDRTVGSDK